MDKTRRSLLGGLFALPVLAIAPKQKPPAFTAGGAVVGDMPARVYPGESIVIRDRNTVVSTRRGGGPTTLRVGSRTFDALTKR